jgi:hypothetical protein
MRFSSRQRAAAVPPTWRLGVASDPNRLLAAADRLVADDKALDALRLLTRANRRRRDARIAQRIVELRFDAFGQMQWTRDQPSWPEGVPDLFPNADLPEITSENLTAERLRSAIVHHGSLIVRGLAKGGDVDRLVVDIDRAFAAYDAVAARRDPADLRGWFVPYRYDRTSDRPLKRASGSVLAVDSPPAMSDLVEVFERGGVGRLARDYFGERPAALAKKWSLRKVPRDANTGDWHQDGAFMGGGIRSLNVWLTLTHCGDNAPGLDVVGRRFDHVLPTGTEGAYFAWSVGAPVAQRAAAGSIRRPVFEAGDAMLFDHFCLHRTAVDPGMTYDRYAIESWFLAPSTYGAMSSPDGQDYAPRDQIPIVY